MGHESQIEPWLPLLVGLRTDWLRRKRGDENRWERNPKRYTALRSVPRSRNGRREPSCSMGWAGRQEKIRPQEKCFFLDSFYRTNQELGANLILAARGDCHSPRRDRPFGIRG